MLHLKKKNYSVQKNIIIELALTGGLKHTVSLKERGEQEGEMMC